MTRRIGFFVFPDFQLLDLSGPASALHLAGDVVPGAYHISVMALPAGPVASSSAVTVTAQAARARGLDSFVIVGGRGVHAAAASPATVTLVRRIAASTQRVASVCTGAFLLAETGLLDGRHATTHWRYSARFASAYPAVRVAPDRIFICDGNVWTSAGVTAGIDLALGLIEADLGADVARSVAREMVVYYRRPGGQSQFSTLHALDPLSARIGRALRFARDHLAEPLPVERLAEVAHLSPRQFGRAFAAETGQTPAKAIERLRVETARPMVEESGGSLEAIAGAVGFGDAERMRLSFIRVLGRPPQAVRREARAQRSVA